LPGGRFRGCGRHLAPILGERIEPGFLLVFEQVIESCERRLHGQCGLHHRPDARLHDGQPARRRERRLRRTRRPDHLGGPDQCTGQFVQRGALRLVRRYRLSNLIDGETGHFAIIAAKLT